jgi:putative endonuclease
VLIVPRSFVYILANRPRGVMYVGSTGSVLRRLAQHKSKAVDGFTSKYGVTRLVHLEVSFDQPSTRAGNTVSNGGGALGNFN